MTQSEFNEKYAKFGWYDQIIIRCGKWGCTQIETLKKGSAINNMKRNDGIFICRTCAYSEEGKQKISEATSYPRSDETKSKMSAAKKAFYETPEGQELKKAQSRLAAQGHLQNKFENAKRQGWFPSAKMGTHIFYGSSYELRLCSVLESDENVDSYQSQIYFEIDGRGRCLDFVVNYKDGSTVAIEVKPASRLNEEKVISQIEDSKWFAGQQGWKFEICTEETLGMTYDQIRDWADQLRTTLTGIDFVEVRKESIRKKMRRHYEKNIATDTVEVYCEYCKTTHTALRLTHDKNIERNGRYICEKEGGHIAGSKPKKKKVNPYAADGKKQCLKCLVIKDFEEFGVDGSRSDGYATRCKKCRAEIATAKYQNSKKSG